MCITKICSFCKIKTALTFIYFTSFFTTTSREVQDPNNRCIISMANNETTIASENGSVHRFAYDYSFWSHDHSSEFCDQAFVYSKLAQPLLSKAFEGYNTCLFAYGQTGSGKSYW